MKTLNLLTLIIVLLSTRSYSLSPGDITFTGFNADGNDDFSIVALKDLDGRENTILITFTDKVWNGSSFNSGEGRIEWTIDSRIKAGTIVHFRNLTDSIYASIGSVEEFSAFSLSGTDEQLFAVAGTLTSPVFVAAIFNDDALAGGNTLSGTGLKIDTTAIELDGVNSDADIAAYTGTRTGQSGLSDFLTIIADVSNWEAQDASGDQSNDLVGPDIPFSSIVFKRDSTVWTSVGWSNGFPSLTTDVVIQADYDGVGFTCMDLQILDSYHLTVGQGVLEVNGDVDNNGTLVIKSGAELMTYGGKEWIGNAVEVQRFTRYQDGRYSFVGSPVTHDLLRGDSLGSFVYRYDEQMPYGTDGLNRWKQASQDTLRAGVGYTQAYKQLLTFRGVPNAGTIEVEGTYTDNGSVNTDGWVLVSNPYPSSLSVRSFLNGNRNLDGTIYLWDDNGSDVERGTNADYIAVNALGHTMDSRKGNGSRFNNHIGVAQAFFVRIQHADSSHIIHFVDSMRATGFSADDNFFRLQTDRNVLKLHITDESQQEYSETLLGFLSDATNSVDRDYDAVRMKKKGLSVYSYLGESKYAIQALPNDFKEGVKIGIDGLGQRDFYMDMEVLDGSIHKSNCVLHDTWLGISHSFEQGGYVFENNSSRQEPRFWLEITSSTSTVLSSTTHQGALDFKVLPHGININNKLNHTVNFKVFDPLGNVLMEKEFNPSGANSFIPYYFTRNRLYLISVNSKTKKIIFQN